MSTNQVPNGTIQQGQIWTPAQWNTAWQSKVDASGGFSTNETLTTPQINDPTIVGGTQASPAITTPAVTGGTFSAPAITNPTVTGNLPVTGNVSSANITSGTFTATLTGMTATVTAAAKYTIAGSIAIISIPSVSGTSNANTFTITGLPSILQPATLPQIVSTLLDIGSASATGWAQVSPGNSSIVMLLDVVIGSVVSASTTAFATSGVKGLFNLSIAYQLQ